MDDIFSDYGSKALDYLKDNEWAANALAGAATAGLTYLAAQDQIKAQRRETQRQREHQMYLSSAGDVNVDQYGDYSTLTNGALTDSGLLSQAKK